MANTKTARFPEATPGAVVRVHQKITDVTPKGQTRERIQVFEGMVIARKHGSSAGATVTVRKDSNGVGVEKIFPLYLPSIEKIEAVKQFRTRRSKLYYTRAPRARRLRDNSGKAGSAGK